MRYIFNSLLTILFPLLLSAQSAWPLQPWLVVKGKVKGELLGSHVAGLKPQPGFPYKAAVSRGGVKLGYYTLTSNIDTVTKLLSYGGKVLQGDITGDGIDELIISKEPSYPSPNEGYDTVYIVRGTPDGPDFANPIVVPSELGMDFLSVGCLGDINNNGKTDLVLIAHGYPQGRGDGKIYIYLNPVRNSIPDAVLNGDGISYFFGLNSAIGDLNNDGLNDLIVRGDCQNGPTATHYGYLNIYWGDSIGHLNLSRGLQIRGAPLFIAGLGCFDVNSDGIDDLLWYDAFPDWITKVKIHFGRKNFVTTYDMVLENPGADFGEIIMSGYNLNGKGNNDIITGASRAVLDMGYIFVFSGGPNMDNKFDAAAGLSGYSWFGKALGPINDVNGDSITDIIVGAPLYNWNYNYGYWAILLGDKRIPIVGVEQYKTETPSEFVLLQNYPNPFNPTTTIAYQLKSRAFVTLKVYNILGQEIMTLVNCEKDVGIHKVFFDGSKLPSGVYTYKLMVQKNDKIIHTETKLMDLVK